MKSALKVAFALAMLAGIAFGEESPAVETRWIPFKPEVHTYKSTSPEGEGLYQVSLSKDDSTIQVYLNIIAPGFTKTVSGTMGLDMRPLASEAKIVVNSQVVMETRCSYETNRLHISTILKPYKKVMKAEPTFDGPTVDFSQIPILTRVLRLEPGSLFTFNSLNPQSNTIVPLSLRVVGEETAGGIECFKVEVRDFEGTSFYWVERGSGHRVIRVEQPESHRVTELLQ